MARNTKFCNKNKENAIKFYLYVRILRQPIHKTNGYTDSFTQNFTPFTGHSIGQSDGWHTSGLRYANQTLCMPSKFVEILKKKKNEK